MGDRLTGEEEPQQANPAYGNIFDELFPHYLVMGMTPEQYWDGESWLKPAYREAYKLRMENERRSADMHNWYMGQYIMSVLNATPLLVGGFVKPGAELPDYPDKPFFEKQEEIKREEDRKKKEEDQSKLAMALFQAMTTKLNRNIEKRLEREGSGQ